MATPVNMPKMGLTMTTGMVAKWLKEEGDSVKKGEPVAEVETEKLVNSIEAPADGVLLKIVAAENVKLPIGGLMGIIGTPGEDISSLLAAGSAPASEHPPGAPAVPGAPEAAHGPVAAEGGRVKISPAARKLAEEKGIDYTRIKGTGPEGRITKEDLLQYLETSDSHRATPLARKIATLESVSLADVPGTGSGGKITRSDVERYAGQPVDSETIGGRTGRLIPLTGMRSGIARKMLDSLHVAAQANHRMSVDMTETLRLKDRLRDSGVRVSITDILVKAVARALAGHPIVNSTLTDDGILVLDEINIGVATALDEGLLVPVIRRADSLSLSQIGAALADLVSRAKSGALKLDETEGGTFTVTNLGMYDLDSFTAIINQPESAILAVGKIAKTCVAIDDQPAIRPVMTLCLTYDHRVIDGAPAARFLQTIRQMLENPYLLL
jgi:pyruvate dehydrogenase E2 component (dihydrolipoamide acetyltransferase)